MIGPWDETRASRGKQWRNRENMQTPHRRQEDTVPLLAWTAQIYVSEKTQRPADYAADQKIT